MTNHNVSSFLPRSHSFVLAGGEIGNSLLLLFAAVVAGLVSVYEPRLLLLPAILGGALLIVSSPKLRLLFVIFGGMFVFQSSQDLSLLKLGYLGGTLLAASAAVLNAHTWPRMNVRAMRPLLNASMLTAMAICITYLPAYLSGISPEAWARDVTPYLLGAAVPLFAIDAARITDARQFSERTLVVLGLFAAASFFVRWANLRGLAELPIDRILLPTAAPAVALFYFSISKTLFSSNIAKGWLLLSILIPIVLLLTATRSSFLLLTGLTLLLIMRKDLFSRSSGRLLVSIVGAVALILAIQTSFSSVLDFTKLTGRLQTSTELLSDPNSDRSFAERQAQTNAALETFASHPLLGAGPGAAIRWSTPWRVSSDFTIDTSLSVLAKFGMVGIALLVVWVVAGRQTWKSLLKDRSWQAGDYTLAAFLFFLVVNAPLLNPIEDKGVSYTILILLTMLLALRREQQEPA